MNSLEQKNPLALAYLGDAVFSIMVREWLVKTRNLKPSGLNKIANGVVCAKTQAKILDNLKPQLTEEETNLILHARNSCSNTKAKNSSLEEYNKATQLECLFGFLWLKEDKQRLNFLFDNFVKELL